MSNPRLGDPLTLDEAVEKILCSVLLDHGGVHTQADIGESLLLGEHPSVAARRDFPPGVEFNRVPGEAVIFDQILYCGVDRVRL